MPKAPDPMPLVEPAPLDVDPPDAALGWRALRWLDEDGVPRDGALELALEARAANLRHWRWQTGRGVAPTGWDERGPDNCGGRTRALLVDAADPDHLWAGAANGGLWSSADAGASWTPVRGFDARLPVACLLADRDPRVLYAGTGTPGDRTLPGQGVLRSTDGGATWSRLDATATWRVVHALANAPRGGVLIAATQDPGGLQRSLDGGDTWRKVLDASRATDVGFDPLDGRRVVAAAVERDADGREEHRAVFSIDGGVTFRTSAGPLASRHGGDARIVLAWAPAVQGLVYACSLGEVFASRDGGATWQATGASIPAPHARHSLALWVDPTDAAQLVAGSADVWRSTDGGASFARISSGQILSAQPHPHVHAIAADPGYDGKWNRRVWVATDGGVYRANDVRVASTTHGWSRCDRGYRTALLHAAAGDGPSGRLVAGSQDNGTLSLARGSRIANLMFGGEGGFCAIDSTASDHVYGAHSRLRLHRSTNGGFSSTYIHDGIADAGADANFVAPFVLDPNHERRMLAGGRSLWVSDDVRAPRPQWRAISEPMAAPISAIAVAHGDSRIVWIGCNDGVLLETRNATATRPDWVEVAERAGPGALPARYVTRILFDRADARRVYVAFGGFREDNLWRTDDGGASWRHVGGAGPTGLPPAPVHAIAQHPYRAELLYVGTAVGVFASDDGGATWATNDEGPGSTSVEDVGFLHNSTTLVAATWGRGLFSNDVFSPSIEVYGTGCAGTRGVPGFAVDPNAPPRLGEPFRVVMNNLVPNSTAYVLIGLSRETWLGLELPFDLGRLGAAGCAAWSSGEVVTPVRTGNGAPSWTVTLPTNRDLLGTWFYASCWSRDAGANRGGFVTSHGIACRIGY